VTAEYAFLHDGIVRSFLARIGAKSGDTAEFWKDGCHFYEETTGCHAIVRCWPGRRGEGENAGTIRIHAWLGNARSLLDPLVEALNQMPIGQRPAIQWSDGESARRPGEPDHDTLNRLRITLEKKVFLSYRHGDSKDMVRRLANVLHKRGWKPIWDEDGLQRGESISAFVDQARVTPFLVPVFSRTYHDSRWCLSELFGFLEGQESRFERLTERAVPVVLDDVQIDQPEHRRQLAEQLQAWCRSQEDKATLLAPKDVELLQFMQSWYPRMARVLERLSDSLLPRGSAAVSADDFRVVADTLDERYARATRRAER
jgi:internalin A